LRLEEPANYAFVFIKPHANTPAVRELVHSFIVDNTNPYDDGVGRINAQYDITSEHIENGRLVDKQFKALARHAMEIAGLDAFASISAKEFQKAFGEDLNLVKKEKRIYNALEALSALACNPAGLEQAWREAERDSSKGKIKYFGDIDHDGFYCGNLFLNGKNVYVINGFYMALRGEYIEPAKSIHACVIQWSQDALSWKDFRSKIIGTADPAKAEIGSLRRMVYDKYRELGLDAKPNVIDNVIHVSASPLEGLAERMNWCSRQVNQDEYGRLLLGRGIPESKILDWCDNVKLAGPVPVLEAGLDGFEMKNVFDVVKDTDSKVCADKLTGLYDYELFGSTIQGRDRCAATGGGCCVIS